MSDTTTPDAPTPDATNASEGEKSTQSCRSGRRRRHWRKGLFGVGLLALALFALPRAFAGHGWGGGCDHNASWTTEGVREHLGWASERLVDRADGTDEQEKKVNTILDQVAPDVVAFREEGREIRGDLRAALTAPAVSRESLEQVRQDGLDLADRASAVAMDTLAELAAVFSPEQRQKLARGWAEHHREK